MFDRRGSLIAASFFCNIFWQMENNLYISSIILNKDNYGTK